MEPEKQESAEPVQIASKKKDARAKWIIGIVAALVLIVGAYAAYEMNKSPSMNTINPGQNQNSAAVFKTITIGNATLSAEIADTPDKLTQGLSDRTSMASSSGMLFEFNTPERYEFWMKDMHFPLDFVWIGQNMKVVDITKNVPADSYPQLYAPKSVVTKVLEVNAGFVDASKIKIGDTLTISQ